MVKNARDRCNENLNIIHYCRCFKICLLIKLYIFKTLDQKRNAAKCLTSNYNLAKDDLTHRSQVSSFREVI